ncbi:MAG: tetratricopeptide repeat protein [Thermodesulfobacteriota bacterium]
MDISQLTATAETLTSILSSQQAQRDQLAQYALMRGLSFLQEKNYDRATGELKRAVTFNPNLEEAYEYLGKVYQLTGKTKEAIETFKKWVGNDPTSEKGLIALGNAYVENKQYDEAEAQFKRLARIDPSSAYPFNSLGHIYLSTEHYDEAKEQFKKVIKLSPRDANGYYGLGLALNKQGEYKDAVEQFETAVSYKKNFEYAYSDMAHAYIGLGKKVKAEELVETLYDIGTDLAKDLATEIELTLFTPQITSVKPLDGTFPSVLGARTPLSVLDASLSTPSQSKVFSLTFQFNQAMDIASVQNSLNWFIFKAGGGPGGYYNDGITLQPEKEIMLSPIPNNVSYDPTHFKATVFFAVTQNSTGDGVMDPSHWVFKFKGTDVSGNMIDSSADEYCGSALNPF